MSSLLGQRFSPLGLLRFALPSMVTMIFMSLYTIVDGIFVSRFAGSNALSAINIVYPIPTLLIGFSIMMSAGGSALVGSKLGQKKEAEANQTLSLLAAFGLVFCILAASLILPFARPLSFLLGANDEIASDAVTYLVLLTLFAPCSFLQTYYQFLMVTAGKPGLGLALIIGGGIANMVLDYILIGVMGMGIAGAGLATGIGQCIPALLGSLFFFANRKGLCYSRFRFSLRPVIRACANGISEMVSQISTAVVTLMLNLILMRMEGPDGVAAITILLYSQFVFAALFLGFISGVGPIFSYHLGAENLTELRRLYRISKRFILSVSCLVALLSFLGADLITGCFVPPDSNTYRLASHGFRLFSLCYLFSGYNIFGSGLFTALMDGKHSAIISFCRTFGFIAPCLLILPELIGLNGVWLSVPAAECICFLLTAILLKKKLPM